MTKVFRAFMMFFQSWFTWCFCRCHGYLPVLPAGIVAFLVLLLPPHRGLQMMGLHGRKCFPGLLSARGIPVYILNAVCGGGSSFLGLFCLVFLCGSRRHWTSGSRAVLYYQSYTDTASRGNCSFQVQATCCFKLGHEKTPCYRAQILGIRMLVGFSLHPYLGYLLPVDVVQLCYSSDPSIPVQVPLISTLQKPPIIFFFFWHIISGFIVFHSFAQLGETGRQQSTPFCLNQMSSQ